MRSPFTTGNPPPREAPEWVRGDDIGLWAAAAPVWCQHPPLRDPGIGLVCRRCLRPWPCPPWCEADLILAAICAEHALPPGARMRTCHDMGT